MTGPENQMFLIERSRAGSLPSSVVGGIAGLAALSNGPEISGKTALLAFAITALVELRKYRKL